MVTDDAAGLLEDAQRELGEGPGLAAYAEEAAVAVVDLANERDGGAQGPPAIPNHRQR